VGTYNLLEWRTKDENWSYPYVRPQSIHFLRSVATKVSHSCGGSPTIGMPISTCFKMATICSAENASAQFCKLLRHRILTQNRKTKPF
jgi:hypothetical protein